MTKVFLPLQRENKRLRAALQEIASYEGPAEKLDVNARDMRACARECVADNAAPQVTDDE